MGEVPLKLVEGGEDLPSEAGNGHFRFTGGDLYFGTSTGWKNLTNPPAQEQPQLSLACSCQSHHSVCTTAEKFQVVVSPRATTWLSTAATLAQMTIRFPQLTPYLRGQQRLHTTSLRQAPAAPFLSVAPGDVASTTVSTINWSSANIDIANSSIVKVDGSRQVKVFCDGYPGAASDFIMDIVGYYQ